MNLNINITPAISVGCIGGLGYILGKYANIYPKQVALICLITETVRQVFLFLNDSFNLFSEDEAWYFSVMVSYSIGLVIGLGLLSRTELISREKLKVFVICSMCAISSLTAALSHFRVDLHCQIR